MSDTVITFDMDWAPDFVIEEVSSMLRRHNVKSTWFVTHDSPAVRELQNEPDLFELGIHPNFLPNSSHGSTVREVIKHCLEIVPDAQACRTHCLIQSAEILDELIQQGIKMDASLLLFGAKHLEPVRYYSSSGSIWRVPYCWEDCCQLHKPGPLINDLTSHPFRGDRPRVFAFHPIHIYLNSVSMMSYRNATRNTKPLNQQTETELSPHTNHDFGIRNLFTGLLQASQKNASSKFLRDLTQHNTELRSE
ncbi:MAG: hypothetical protein P1U77_28835 [Rubripirellula sp.]|nr:hypothetical protein [Rubripirellula sp.]